MREIKFRAWDNVEEQMVYVNSLPLMQYTGLKDKNGKEIYEGDIVKFRNDWMDQEDDLGEQFIEVVYWDYNEWRTEHFNKCEGDIVPFEEMEIIGNIYENPELLGDKK